MFKRCFTSAAMALPLQGVKILDLTSALAGPTCTMYLGDLGAEVIKLEIPKKGDDSRHFPPFRQHKDDPSRRESIYNTSCNRNKKSITVDLKTAEGASIARKLADQSDILVDNFVTGRLEKLGLGYAQLKTTNPRLIHCSITGYGQTGPYKSAPGYDVVVGAEAGLLDATGEADRPPVRPGIPVTDLIAGYHAMTAILAALLSRQISGEGVRIDTSMFDCQVAAMGSLAGNWLNEGIKIQRVGTGHTSVAPYGAFATKDGYLMIGIANDGQFQKLCHVLGTDWAQSESFSNNTQRVRNKNDLITKLELVLQKKTSSEWKHLMADKGFPFGSVNSMEEVFQHPSAIARELTGEQEHTDIGRIRFVNPPVVYNGSRLPVKTMSPALGAHNTSVLQELGYDEDMQQNLRARGVI